LKRNYIWGYENEKKKDEYHCSTEQRVFGDVSESACSEKIQERAGKQ
jgi:hypothetical protein